MITPETLINSGKDIKQILVKFIFYLDMIYTHIEFTYIYIELITLPPLGVDID